MLRCTPPLGCDISKFEFRNIVRECCASQPPLGYDISKFEFRNIVRAVGHRAYRARVQHVARRQPGCPRWHCHGRHAARGAHAARPTAVPCRPARSRGHPSCFPARPRRPAGRRPDSGRPAPTSRPFSSTHFTAVPPRTGDSAWFPAIRGCAHAGTPARCSWPAIVLHKWPVGAGGATGRHPLAAASGAARPLAPLAAGLAAAGAQPRPPAGPIEPPARCGCLENLANECNKIYAGWYIWARGRGGDGREEGSPKTDVCTDGRQVRCHGREDVRRGARRRGE